MYWIGRILHAGPSRLTYIYQAVEDQYAYRMRHHDSTLMAHGHPHTHTCVMDLTVKARDRKALRALSSKTK